MRISKKIFGAILASCMLAVICIVAVSQCAAQPAALLSGTDGTTQPPHSEGCYNDGNIGTDGGEHVWAYLEEVKPNCTQIGFTRSCYCVNCGKVAQVREQLAPLGHKIEVIPAVAADCTHSGYTQGEKCSVCGEITSAPQVSRPLGHNFSREWITDIYPTADKPGEKSRHCLNCSVRTEIMEIPALTSEKPQLYVFSDSGAMLNRDNKTVCFVPAGLKYAQLLTIFELDGNRLIVKTPTGKELTVDDTDIICTGFTVRIFGTDEKTDTWVMGVRGDINRDGLARANDARTALRIAAGLEPSADSASLAAADFDMNGELKPNDARRILRIAAGLE